MHRLDLECPLNPVQQRRYLNEKTRVWSVNDEDLTGLDGDLQSILNCTRQGDIVLLNVSESLRPPERLIIPWSLTISALTPASDPVDGRFPLSSNPSVFHCPRENEGTFLIW